MKSATYMSVSFLTCYNTLIFLFCIIIYIYIYTYIYIYNDCIF